jgi:hypothetical protein
VKLADYTGPVGIFSEGLWEVAGQCRLGSDIIRHAFKKCHSGS